MEWILARGDEDEEDALKWNWNLVYIYVFICSLVLPDGVDQNGVETSIKEGMAIYVFSV